MLPDNNQADLCGVHADKHEVRDDGTHFGMSLPFISGPVWQRETPFLHSPPLT